MTEESNNEIINRHLAAIKQKIAQAKDSYDQDQLKQVPAEEEDIYDAVLRYRKEHTVKLNIEYMDTAKKEAQRVAQKINNMKNTKVRIIQNHYESRLSIGDEGFIDGYLRGADDRPYAVVICGKIVEMVPLYTLEVID